jgi:hypothetical protein
MTPEEPIPELELDEPLDLIPILTRKLTWDSLPCDEVEGILAKLGLTPSHPDGAEIEHQNSHDRITMVMPMEPVLQQLASVLGTIVSLAMTEEKGVTEQLGDGMEPFAEQNAEVALTASRAVLAALFDEGIIMYTPEAMLRVLGAQ